MKPINEMNLEELAAYAVTLDCWRWMPGMSVTFPPPRGGCGAECVSPTATLVWGDTKSRRDEAWCYLDVPDGCTPNLASPATLGCVLAMVRKKHGESAYSYLDPHHGWIAMLMRPIENEMTRMHTLQGLTEAHALIAALTKEVEP